MTDSTLTLVESPMSTVVAPSRLTAENRVDFRAACLDALEALPPDADRVVVVDLGAVVDIDASGLGILLLLQKRARERAVRVRLTQVPGVVDRLLDETRLEPMFEVDRGA